MTSIMGRAAIQNQLPSLIGSQFGVNAVTRQDQIGATAGLALQFLRGVVLVANIIERRASECQHGACDKQPLKECTPFADHRRHNANHQYALAIANSTASVRAAFASPPGKCAIASIARWP